MRSLTLKLLALVAYLAMPFTMSAAMPAVAAPGPSHHAAMAAAAGMDEMAPCPEQGMPSSDHSAFIGCSMMCAALPALNMEGRARPLFGSIAPVPAPVRAYSGISLEIATPPPRHA